jgi:hypothetical protein
VFATAMIMLNACDFPHLTAYQVHFERLARQFGPQCWAILYQAAARFRREGLERVRRDESDKLEVALNANGDYPFEPLRPWNRCFKVAPAQYHYWHTNVEVPCLLVLSRARTSGFFLDGDAETSASSSAHVATQNAPQHELGLPGGSQADSSGVAATSERHQSSLVLHRQRRQRPLSMTTSATAASPPIGRDHRYAMHGRMVRVPQRSLDSALSLWASVINAPNAFPLITVHSFRRPVPQHLLQQKVRPAVRAKRLVVD